MLPTELLSFRVKNGVVEPRRFKPTPSNLALAGELITLYTDSVGQRRADIEESLQAFEAGRRDRKVIRGLARLLEQASDFGEGAGVEPAAVRELVFKLAQQGVPSRRRTGELLRRAGDELGLSSEEVQRSLYADLASEQLLLAPPETDPKALLQRYDLAQAQGLLYRAYSMVVTAHRDDPVRYRQLLRFTKLFGLMVTVQGDAEQGFTLTFDGPASLFGGTTRYGLSMAKFLPALLQVTRWDMSAQIKARKDLSWIEDDAAFWSFELTSEDGYVGHYKEGKDFDSKLESGFAERFAKLDTPWRLEREVDLVPVRGGVILPDFRLVHADGRSVLMEIVGYWRPEYLQRKFRLLRDSGRRDVIVCVSDRLNLEKAGVDASDFAEQVMWFKGVLPPKAVLERAEALASRVD